MHLIHEPSQGADRVLATRIELADSFVSKARGLMFRRAIPDEFALVFPFDRVRSRSVHMVGVPFPIDVLWMDGEVVREKRQLDPWVGIGRGQGDTIVELSADRAAGISPGDVVRLVE